jgi:tetratricopeptide (TPR) repeat protein
MRRDAKRRGALYGGAVGAGALLLFLGFGFTLPPDMGTRLSGAAMLSGLGAHDDALAEVDRAIEENPDALEPLVYRAAILSKGERYDEALSAYDRALGHAEATGTLRRGLQQDRASILLALGRMEEFQKVRDELAADGVDKHVHALDAIAAIRRDDWEAAAGFWEKAYRADENAGTRQHYYSTLVTLGRHAIKEREFEAARGWFDKARELVPQINQPYLESAQAALAENDPEGAMTAMESCPDGTPGVTPLRVRAATMLLESGKSEAAWKALGDAFRCDGDAAAALVEVEPAWKDLGDAERIQALKKQ